MGKGSRNSQKKLTNEPGVNQAENKIRKNKKNSGKAVAAACIAFALIIVAVLVLNVLTETGVFVRATNALELDGVVVDAAMMSFFYNDYLMSWYNNYSGYMSYMGVDFTASLKLQTFPKGGLAGYILGEEYDGTWYDYFLEKVTENVEMYITFCDAANKENITLDADDLAEVEESVKTIMDSVKESGSSLGDWFGRGVNEDDVRRCYKIITLANKYSEHKYETLENEIKAEEESGKTPIEDYIENNKESFYTAEYLSYEIKVSGKNYNEEEYAAKVEKAKADAQKIANAGSVEAFLELVNQYEIENNIVEENESKTETSTETVDIEELADEYRDTISYETETGTESDDSLVNWIFEEGASEGEGRVFDEEETETIKVEKATTETGTEDETESESEEEKKNLSYKVYTVTAYMITQPSHLDTDLTNNFSYIVANNKADVEAMYNQFVASKDKTLDSFVNLAEAYYEQLVEDHEKEHSEEEHEEPVFLYNKAEKVAKDYFNNSYFGESNDADAWLDTELQGGMLSPVFAVEIEQSKDETVTYYVLVYFDSRDREEWYVNGLNGLIGERFDDWYENTSGKKNIQYNQNALEDIKTIVLY